MKGASTKEAGANKKATRKSASRKPATGRKRVKFSLQAEPGSEVYVAGSFNGWNPKKNKLKLREKAYETAILMEPGRYEYKFVVNGVWCVDPMCAEWEPNELGSLNSVIEV